MAELITWAPRVGATGDNQYKFGSGASMPKIYRGTVGGSTPSVSDVNALTGINQIVAEIKRQGGSASYVSDGTQKVSKTFITSLQTAINSIRTGAGASSYSFTSITDGTVKISNSILLQLRKALAVTQTTVTGSSWDGRFEFQRKDIPYGTLYTESTNHTPRDTWIGKANLGGVMNRYRFIFRMPRPSGTLSAYTFNLKFDDTSVSIIFSTSLESFGNLNVYCVNNTTDWYNTANLAVSASVSAGTNIPLALDVSVMNAMSASAYFYLMFATSVEIATGGSSTPGTSGLGIIPFETRDFAPDADYTTSAFTY